MSLEAIKKVTETEQDVQARRAEAAASAKKLVADAEKEGQAILDAARRTAEDGARQAMRGAEERAAAQTERALIQAGKDCDALRRSAQARLDQAAELIVRRVVNV